MPQPLVVNWPDEDQGLQFVPGVGIKHGFVPVALIAVGVHLTCFGLHVEMGEWGGVLGTASQGGELAD